MPTNETLTGDDGIPIARVSHYNAGGIVCILIILPVLVALLGAALWLTWILATGLLGSKGAAVAVLILAVCAAEVSWRSCRGLASSLIMIGFAGFTLLTGALFGVAGYMLFFGG
jgi:hypothetical protein